MVIPAIVGTDTAGADGAVDAGDAALGAVAACFGWCFAAQQVVVKSAATERLTRSDRTMLMHTLLEADTPY